MCASAAWIEASNALGAGTGSAKNELRHVAQKAELKPGQPVPGVVAGATAAVAAAAGLAAAVGDPSPLAKSPADLSPEAALTVEAAAAAASPFSAR